MQKEIQMTQLAFLESLEITDITSLNGFHNTIYKGNHHNQNIMIRVTPVGKRRTKEMLEAEKTFLLACHNNNIPVGLPYTINQQSVIENDGLYYIFFQYVDGGQWHEYTHDETTYYTAGKYLALIHQTSLNLPKISRETYTDHPDITLLNELDDLYKKTLDTTLEELDKWPKTKTNYGLIHGDYLFSNMIYHEDGDLTIIDFDDIEYGYYLYDIAVYLFYYLLGGNPSEIDKESNITLFKQFMSGYESVSNDITFDMRQLQTLFRLRQLKLLATIKTVFNEDTLGPWQKSYLKKTDTDFLENRPFVDIDYVSLYETIKKP